MLNVSALFPLDELGADEMGQVIDQYDEVVCDNITGEEPAELVKAARQSERTRVRGIELHAKVPRKEMIERGFTPVGTRWVDMDKGDRVHWNPRSIICARAS